MKRVKPENCKSWESRYRLAQMRQVSCGIVRSMVIAVLLMSSCPLARCASSRPPPLFADYPVNETFRGEPKPVDLQSHPAAREYRTRLREVSKGMPSFAAYYVVAEWGCGSPCQQVALIDARSGAVHFAPFATSLGNRHWLNSRLFVADAPEDISEYCSGKIPKDSIFSATYWLWDETAKQFRSLPTDSSRSKPNKQKGNS